MVQFTWSSDAGFDFETFSFGSYLNASSNILDESPTYLAVTTPMTDGTGVTVGVQGSGFTYDAVKMPNAGTVNAFSVDLNNQVIAQVTGLSLDISAIRAVAMTPTKDDDLALVKSVLSGNDVIHGGSGKDYITGFQGADKLYGGRGGDRFIFTSTKDSTVSAKGRDTIYDFSHKQHDKIDLTAIDAHSKTLKNESFTFIGNENFHHRAGELHYVRVGGNVDVSGDTNGDGHADFSIVVKGVTSVEKGDFYL